MGDSSLEKLRSPQPEIPRSSSYDLVRDTSKQLGKHRLSEGSTDSPDAMRLKLFGITDEDILKAKDELIKEGREKIESSEILPEKKDNFKKAMLALENAFNSIQTSLEASSEEERTGYINSNLTEKPNTTTAAAIRAILKRVVANKEGSGPLENDRGSNLVSTKRKKVTFAPDGELEQVREFTDADHSQETYYPKKTSELTKGDLHIIKNITSEDLLEAKNSLIEKYTTNPKSTQREEGTRRIEAVFSDLQRTLEGMLAEERVDCMRGHFDKADVANKTNGLLIRMFFQEIADKKIGEKALNDEKGKMSAQQDIPSVAGPSHPRDSRRDQPPGAQGMIQSRFIKDRRTNETWAVRIAPPNALSDQQKDEPGIHFIHENGYVVSFPKTAYNALKKRAREVRPYVQIEDMLNEIVPNSIISTSGSLIGSLIYNLKTGKKQEGVGEWDIVVKDMKEEFPET